jgi:hypothetical protein
MPFLDPRSDHLESHAVQDSEVKSNWDDSS